jgi:hypothetical protein
LIEAGTSGTTVGSAAVEVAAVVAELPLLLLLLSHPASATATKGWQADCGDEPSHRVS